jgi:hypothetical protein
MQTPAGFRREADGKFAPVSWMDAIFTPSLPYRYLHMVTAAYLAGTFVVIGVCGFYLWRRRHQDLPAPDFPLLCGSYWFSCRFRASWATCTGETLPNINQSRLRPWRAIGRRALANISFYSPGPTLPTSATTTSSRFRGSEV